MEDVKKDVLTQVKNDEEKIEFDISVKEFDVSQSHLDTVEDLDEKTTMYIEKQIRNSYEYRSYIQYLKEELDLTKCALLPTIDIKTDPISLEFHHFPFTLFDVTQIVGKSMLDEAGESTSVSTFDIAEKVMMEHFKNNIGLVPLTVTLHEMAHNGAINIPFDKINGKYNEFIKEYNKFIEPDFVERLRALEQYNSSEEAKKFNDEKLKKRIANYNIEYKKEDDLDV
jgi:hypothetical protein